MSTATPFPPSPSCPCCSFLSAGGAFLTWNKGDQAKEDVENARATLSISAEEVISPNQTWEKISAMVNCAGGAVETKNERPVILVDTHGHPHLQREVQYTDATTSPVNSDDNGVVSLTCAVSPLDWKDALDYASRSTRILPALGVHPWYLGDIMADLDIVRRNNHERNIEKYLNWEWLSELETHLSTHPHLLVGEIGLCKMARFLRDFPNDQGGKTTALQLQQMVFRKQLDVAAKWCRPVTVHCVNSHGSFMEILKDILNEAKDSSAGMEMRDAKKVWRRAFPPAIAMHSFTGTAHHVCEILDFEKEVLHPEQVQGGGKRRQKKWQQRDDAPSSKSKSGDDEQGNLLFYFGFSHVVNHLMCTSVKARKRGTEAVRSIPLDRLLVESDVHASADVGLGTAGAVGYAARVRGETLEGIAESTTRNGLRFLNTLGPRGQCDAKTNNPPHDASTAV